MSRYVDGLGGLMGGRPKITGQLFVRETGARRADGRRLVVLCGIVAVPDDVPLKGEHQHVVSASYDDQAVLMDIWAEGAVDRSEEARANSLDGLLAHSLGWRV